MSAPSVTGEIPRVGVIAGNIGPAKPVRNLNGHPSVDVRLTEKWGITSVATARARRNRTIDDLLDVVDAYLTLGDNSAVGRILDLLNATMAGRELPKGDPIYLADKADAEEDVCEAEYRAHPSIRTARAWFDALGREGRSTEPAMASLRAEWEF